MEFQIRTNSTLINKNNLNPYQYTVSLLKEGFRAGLLNKQAIDNIQAQIILILRDLIMRYTKGESTSVKIETAEKILNSIYYAIDAFAASFNNPEGCIVLLKTKSINEIYEKGLELVTLCVATTRKLYEEVRKKKLDVPLEVYNAAIEEDLPEFFDGYGVVFGAHETMCSADYPLVFDDMNFQGIFYIKQYLENLETETEFCSLYSKEDIAKILADYGRIYRTDYKQSPFNLFELLINNAVFSVLTGSSGDSLSISNYQFELLHTRFSNLNSFEINALVGEATERMIIDLKIDQPRLLDYIHKYETILLQRIVNAATNDSLHHVVLTDAPESLRDSGIVFEEGIKMSDESFRLIIRRIMECGNITEKLQIIKSSIHSLEDFVDLLKADCLFGDDFAAVFSSLNDMELAALGRIVFFEELRNDLLDLASIIYSQREIETEWQAQYIGFLQGVSEERIIVIERSLNIIDSSTFLKDGV